MANTINITIPLNDLAAAIAQQLLPVLKDLKIQDSAPQVKENYLTRQQTATLLNISLPTLTQYTKYGKIIGHRFGVRVLYKQSEITNALKQIKGGNCE